MSSPTMPLPGSAPPHLPLEERPDPPSIDHLVTEDDTPVDSIYSERQFKLLTDPLYDSWAGPADGRPFLALANVGLFYKIDLPAIVPDALLSLGVSARTDFREKKNRSYFIWEFGKPPDVVFEVVSNTVGGETGLKQDLYAQIGVPYYVIWDPLDYLKVGRWRNLVLRGKSYEPLEKPWLPEIGLGLTLWTGTFQGFNQEWLRWCDQRGQVILTGGERAAQAERRAEALAAQLRSLGIEPKP